mmetsp:Transcript_85179/g.178010  ORF Transcript_85179/g.178010 Transcript_85179/m.178010 type:complete len:106 (-) Transcript_85179:186-503(-)
MVEVSAVSPATVSMADPLRATTNLLAGLRAVLGPPARAEVHENVARHETQTVSELETFRCNLICCYPTSQSWLDEHGWWSFILDCQTDTFRRHVQARQRPLAFDI